MQKGLGFGLLDKIKKCEGVTFGSEYCDEHFYLCQGLVSSMLLVGWFVSRITGQLLKRFPQDLDGGWFSVFNRPHSFWCWAR